jgi:mRNA interferase HigB
MRIIARSTLKRFLESQTGRSGRGALKGVLDAWFDEARRAEWTNMAAVKQLYRSASVVSADRVVFNIKGNDYRLVTAMDFEKCIVWIKWIGTHSEYDRIDVKTVAYERTKTDPE